MLPRDIVLANIEHRDAPRPAMNFDHGRIDDFHFEWHSTPSHYQQKRWVEGIYEYYDDCWGNIWKRMKDGCEKGEVDQPILSDWSEIEKLPRCRFDIESDAATIRERFAAADEQLYKVLGIGGWIFDNARYIRDMQTYFMDMVLHPEELHQLHAMIAASYEDRIHIAGRSGADAIIIYEDMGTQRGLLFSPEMFRLFFKKLYSELMGLAHSYDMKVIMHSCGQNWAILEDLCDCGVDVFQFDQPNIYDLDQLAALFKRRRVALYSPVDIQKVMPTGDREFIIAETERLYRAFEGFMIGKNYPDLPGIGVREEWDEWAYGRLIEMYGIKT